MLVVKRSVVKVKNKMDWGGGFITYWVLLECGHTQKVEKKRNGRIPPKRSDCMICSSERAVKRLKEKMQKGEI